MCDVAAGAPRIAGRPRWGVLYALTLGDLAALALVEAVRVPDSIRALASGVLVLAAFTGAAWWVRANRAALDLQQWCDCAPRTITVRVIESPRLLPGERPEPPRAVDPEPHELVHA